MSVQTTVTRFANLWAAFSAEENGQRIETTFENIPRTLSPAMCPAVIIIPGRATYDYDQHGENIAEEQREYSCILCVLPASFGESEQGQTLIEPYFSAVRDYFAARPGLELPTDTVTVWQSRITNDSGYFLFEYPVGSEEELGLFHAIEFTFLVKELVGITYVN